MEGSCILDRVQLQKIKFTLVNWSIIGFKEEN